MNGTYSSLINSIPSQISLTDPINPILNYQNLSSQSSADSSSLLNFYNPAYAVAAQTRLLSSLQPANSPCQPTGIQSPTDGNMPPSGNSNNPDQQSMPTFPAELTPSNAPSIPFYASQNFANNNHLCCDFNSAWRSAAHMMAGEHNPYMGYDGGSWTGPYGCIGNPALDLNTARRKNATRESTSTLKAWLQEHIKNPYPTKGEKIMLAIITKMTLTQVSTWFANARRRLKKENKMTWSPKNRSDDGTASDQEGDVKCKENDSEDTVKKDNQSDALSDPEESHSNKTSFSSSNTSDVKPKIWSLAHTATAALFPMALQPYARHCVEGVHDAGGGSYPGGIGMPLIPPSHPIYQQGLPHPLDIPSHLPYSDIKPYNHLYPEQSPNIFAHSQKRSECCE